MKEFEIWIEGYAATGESSSASYLGKAKGNTFREACLCFVYPNNYPYEPARGTKLKLDNPKTISYPEMAPKWQRDQIDNDNIPRSWACRYFDNEIDARKSFG